MGLATGSLKREARRSVVVVARRLYVNLGGINLDRCAGTLGVDDPF